MELLSVRQVAKRLGVSKWLVYRLADSGELRHTMVGTRRKFEPSHVEAYIAARMAGGVREEAVRAGRKGGKVEVCPTYV